jgi:hypothetical protein
LDDVFVDGRHQLKERRAGRIQVINERAHRSLAKLSRHRLKPIFLKQVGLIGARLDLQCG